MALFNWLTRTMLIERFSGVAVYAGLLLVMYYKIRRAKSHKSLNRILNVYIFLLCVMGFFYIPGTGADLYRWRATFTMYGWAEQSFLQFFNEQLSRTATPVSHLYMYLLNRTGIDGLLPAFCTLVFYGNAFAVLKDLYRKHRLSAPSIAVSLFFLMAGGSFLELISGVRCFVSLGILGRCFYEELYNDKPILKNIVWEVFAALTHSMAAVILVGRLLFTLVQKNKRPTQKILNIFLAVMIAVVAYAVGGEYIASGLLKAERYLTADSTYTYFWEYLIGAIMIVQFCVVLLKQWSALKKTPGRDGMRNLMRLNLAMVAVELLLAFEYNIFHRMVMLSTIMMIPMVADAVNDPRNRGLGRIIMMFSVVVLFVACARGNLCGYKFMLLN